MVTLTWKLLNVGALTWKHIYGWGFFTWKAINASALTSKIDVGTFDKETRT